MQEQLTTLQKIMDTAVTFLLNYSFQVIGALLVLILGVIVGNWAAGVMWKFFQSKNLDITLSKFLSGMIKMIILVFAFIIALGKFGISTAPIVAALSAVALGASFAIKGPLSNYGAGISIILSRPFKVGNTITVQGVSGVVDEVTLAYTRLVNEDGVAITIPNSQVVGQILHNSKENCVVESVIGIGYDSNPEAAIGLVKKVLGKYSEVVSQPVPQIGIQNFGESSINIGYRYWVPTKKYFQISYAVNLDVFKAFREAHVTLPFPQREIRVLSGAESLK